MDLDKLCLWYDCVQNGTTGKDVKDESHPLWMCKVCNDPYNKNEECDFYRSENYYKDKNNKLIKD